jgi:hypothetical protein
MAPRPSKRPIPPKPVTKFSFGAYMFGIQEAGPIREPILGLYIGDGTNSRYCAWFSSFKVHAIDWALMNNTNGGNAKLTMFSKLGGNVPLTNYEVKEPITIDALVPENNRTQIGIARQMDDSFFVRFIISSDKNEHHFLVRYPGVAPAELFGKPFWGHLHESGNTPAALSFMFPT